MIIIIICFPHFNKMENIYKQNEQEQNTTRKN